ncbi:hypothetical protein KDW55_25085 [Burkholderia sp. AU19243]|uniref:Uncharacterized protein n=1 Tax=Burkholderia latens TaxID=488446 RepID=A0AAP1G912_9BURK|nr:MULTISPECIES: hypothetical protein [Burkholderia]AIO38308.1 hypothetical protein DM40_4795 [Burkholderia cenocepacia]MBR7961090.1 hypothetical protein [Burkholderia vietnamiensis]AOK07981.1 hypothetical protein WK25_26460 [Burkholderia latens]KVA11284.1 hypothetical protein WI41_07810 [Burkholderia latens]MBR8144863.1 hypothetical protein [Burkholderia vietnamiensis]
MRIFLVALLLYGTQAFAQSLFQNPAVFVILSEQTLANAASVQQALTTLGRPDNTACVPMMMVSDPQMIYMMPEQGHAPSWQSPLYGRGAPFVAQSGPASTGKTIGAMQHAEDMQTQPWSDSSTITQKIAGESSMTASARVDDWQRSGLAAIETARATEVTVGGKTYRSYRNDLNQAAPPVVEPQIYTQRVVFCR